VTRPSGAAVVASYDREADAAYLHLADVVDDAVPTTATVVELARGGPLLLELDGDGCLLGVEVLRASRILPGPLVHRLLDQSAPTAPTQE